MLDLKLLQKNPEVVAKALAMRHSDIDIATFTTLDTRRRALLTEVESLKSERNKASAEVAKAKRAGEDASALIERLGGVSERIKALDLEAEAVKSEQNDWMLTIPNIPHESVPEGRDENDNVEVLR